MVFSRLTFPFVTLFNSSVFALSSCVKLGALTNVACLSGHNDLDLHSYDTDHSLKALAKNQGAEHTAQLPKA